MALNTYPGKDKDDKQPMERLSASLCYYCVQVLGVVCGLSSTGLANMTASPAHSHKLHTMLHLAGRPLAQHLSKKEQECPPQTARNGMEYPRLHGGLHHLKQPTLAICTHSICLIEKRMNTSCLHCLSLKFFMRTTS